MGIQGPQGPKGDQGAKEDQGATGGRVYNGLEVVYTIVVMG